MFYSHVEFPEDIYIEVGVTGSQVFLANAMFQHFVNVCYPLVIEQFAIEHVPFIVDLPIKDGDFP